MDLTFSDKTAGKGLPFFYGWIVVAVGFVTLSIALGLWYSFSVFFLAIVNDFGWSRGSTSSIFSIFLLCHALTGLLCGYLQDRFGPRIVIPLGAIILAMSLVLTSQVNSLWQFIFAYGVLAGASVSLLGFTSHSAFLPNWFERKRGLAVGIATSGIGFGMLCLVPIAEKFISSFGWRTTYLILAGVVLLFVGPLNAIFSRLRPEDLNLRPDGDAPGNRVGQSQPSMMMKIMDADWANENWTLRKAIHTRRFWLLLATYFCLSYAYQGTLLHCISAMVDAGLARNTGAYYFGILGITGSAGKILFGYYSDRLGRERANTVGVITAALGILCLIGSMSVQGPLPLAFALLFGLGYGAAAPLMPSISADIFLGRSFGLIFAMISIGGGGGGALGSFLSGFLRDNSATYSIPLSLCMGSLLLSCLFIWMAGPRNVRRMVKNNTHHG
jgi:MFS family permease